MPIQVSSGTTIQQKDEEDTSDGESLWCYECNVGFISDDFLLRHLLHHIKQPRICLEPIPLAPIKLTIKSKNDNEFEIISSPLTQTFSKKHCEFMATGGYDASARESIHNFIDNKEQEVNQITKTVTANKDENMDYNSGENVDPLSAGIPGAEPTPPPESPTEYPKIRIKTTGLLKDALTSSEANNDSKNNYRPAELVNIANSADNTDASNFWTTPCLEDPLKLPDNDQEDGILSSFLNSSESNKDFSGGSDNEFISLDRLDDRNKNALVPYTSRNSSVSSNSLNSLTGLPMQQLAEQVSRLQPSGGSLHQQNVLINIQQFPQAPPQPPHGYQHPSMYPPHPGMSAQPPPMYQPYQYQPPSPMFFPPTHNYGPTQHMPPPPQMQQPQQMPPQQTMPPPQRPQFRQPMSIRPGIRAFTQQQQTPRAPVARMANPRQTSPRQPIVIPRQTLVARQRMPMVRPRGINVISAPRGPRPRMQQGVTLNGVQNNVQSLQNMKRVNNQSSSPNQQIKKKKLDVLVPDKNDDQDCQVIAVQPKNLDGLPQIQSVQGGTSDPTDNIMHLSDSITLSVRNPPPRVPSPKKSDAKVVANILATRGITVTATPKPKEKSASKDDPVIPSVAINLNSAVSIIPTSKPSSISSSTGLPTTAKITTEKLPMVDLTDDGAVDQSIPSVKSQTPPSKTNSKSVLLPFKCDLCTSQYPSMNALNKHRQMFHKTISSCELGIPLIDFKQPGMVQKLSSLGICNFIPLPSSSPNGTFALPVVSLQGAKNPSICNLSALGASSILPLGPIRPLLKLQNNNVNTPKS